MNLKLIDLHNDLLTSGESSKNYNLAEKSGYKSIYALFKGERKLNEIKEIYSRAVSLGVHNLPLRTQVMTSVKSSICF